MSTPQLSTLAIEWPKTFSALVSTYFSETAWGVTTADGQNDAGYLLQGLGRFKRCALALHAHKGVNHATLDAAAAREVYYHHQRGSKFRRPCAALSACFHALVTERPEKLYAERSRQHAKAV